MLYNTALLAASLATLANAHLTLKHPTPMGKSTLNNSPLNDLAIGASDYPCKQRPGVYSEAVVTELVVGQTHPLTFEGSASHGGGSGQISLSKDLEPTVNSEFKVIKSFVGGFPTSRYGNSGTDEYTFAVPDGIEAGNYTLAWTWYNQIGNRELYMNCARVSVSGGSGSSAFDSLPDMYVINLPSTTCGSVENYALTFPNPGTAVVSAGSAFSAATGSCANVPGAAGGNGGDSGNSGNNQEVPPPQPSTTFVSVVSSTSTESTVVATSTSSVVSESVAPTPTADQNEDRPDRDFGARRTYSADAAVPTNFQRTQDSEESDTGVTFLGNDDCTGSGILCNGTEQFALCDHGKVKWQQVAAGTTCRDGRIVKRSYHVRRAGNAHRHILSF